MNAKPYVITHHKFVINVTTVKGIEEIYSNADGAPIIYNFAHSAEKMAKILAIRPYLSATVTQLS